MPVNVQRTNLYLTGFLAAGKSTVGAELARKLDWRFYDLDALMETRLGKSVERILAEEGEAFYRTLEHEILREVSLLHFAVVALGAGTLGHEANLKLVKESGLLVWLRAAPDALWNRAEQVDRLHRLQNPVVEPGPMPGEVWLRERLESLLEAREPFYNQAEIVVDTTGLSVEDVAEAIVRELREVDLRGETGSTELRLNGTLP